MGSALITDHSRPGLVVEFIGVPGVGKSTVSHRVAELLRETRIPCSEPTYDTDHSRSAPERITLKVKLATLGALRSNHRVVRWVRAIGASGQRSLSESVRLTLNWCYLLESTRRAVIAPGVHIFDQGLFQAWWSLEYGARTPRGLPPELAERLFLPAEGRTVVVALMASVPAALERLHGRPDGASRVDRDLRAAGSPLPVMRASIVFEQLVQAVAQLEGRGNVRLVRIDNERYGATAATALTIASRIEEEYASLARSPVRRDRAPNPIASLGESEIGAKGHDLPAAANPV